MEDPGRDGLDPAAPSQTSPRTESGESEPLAGTTLAGSKKKARRQRAWVFFQDESGVSQRPSIRRTWAPKGKTPVLIHAFNWSKISICAALGYRWDGRRSRLFFQTREGTYNTNSLIAFLKDLKRRLRGQKVILVWDGLPAHKSRAMQEYLFAQRHWLTIEQLPGYAPDLKSKPCGATSKVRNWPTAVLKISPNWMWRSEAAWSEFANPANCHFLSSNTRAFLFDHSVTVLCDVQ
jgi:transposase